MDVSDGVVTVEFGCEAFVEGAILSRPEAPVSKPRQNDT